MHKYELNSFYNLHIKINAEKLSSIIKSNLSCHANKLLNQELIDELSMQIIESVEYFLNTKEE